MEARLVLTAGAFAAVPTGPLPPAAVAGGSGGSAAALPLGLQYAASETLGAADPGYAMTTAGGGYALSNATNDYSARVDAGGFAVAAGADSWSLTVAGVGYGAAASPLGAGSAVASATANRVEYDYGAISQWFVNGPLGLQQGFTLNQRPAGAAAGDPLSIDLAQGGNLVATADPSGTSLSLTRADGSQAMVYGGLTAFDADGAAVPVRFAVDGDKVSILVDDADAVYPLTVDPYVQQQKVGGSSAKPLQFFGSAVAMASSGTVAAISATASSTTVRGSVYVFTTNGTTWSRVAELTSGDGVAGDDFGTSLALSADGKTAVVGAQRMTVGGNANQGKVYVFRQGASPTSWTQVAALTANDGAAADYFGSSTAVSSNGSVIAVGAALADVGGHVDQGAAYVFTASSGTGWSQTSKLTAADAGAGANYGASIAVNSDGSLVAVGAPNAGATGAVYAYYNGAATKLTASGLGLGSSVATDAAGAVLVAGAPSTAVGANSSQGAAFVFTRSGATWSSPTALTASDGAAGDNLGFSAAIDSTGKTIALGAPGAMVGSTQSAGAAYVFQLGNGGAWTQAPRLTPSDPAFAGRFGSAVAVAGVAALAGSPLTPPSVASPSQGAAYFFVNTTPPNPPTPTVTVTSSPSNQTTAAGVPTTFTASATGPAAVTVQWQVSTDGTTWTNVSGATQTWYAITPTTADSGKRFRAVFTGSTGGSATTTAAVLTVAKATPVLSVSTAANPSAIGAPPAITVVAAGAGGVAMAGAPTGSVVVQLQRVGTADAPITLSPGTLANGQVVFTPPTLLLGTYSITATYAGDSVFNGATATIGQVVQRGIPVLTVSSPPPAAAAIGQRVSMTIDLSAVGGLGNMDGGIMILDNGVPIGFPHNVTAGGVTSATFVTAPLAAGTHRFQYVFLGNPQLFATNTGVYQTQVGGSSGAAAPAAPAAQAPNPDAPFASPGAPPAAAPSAQTPGTVTVTSGVPTTLTAAPTSITASSVQWQVSTDGTSWTNVPGANQAWYSFTPFPTNQGWRFRATFSNNSGGSETSAPTTLNVASGVAVQVSSSLNPRSLGSPLTITVTASAAAPGVGAITGGTTTLSFQPHGSAAPPITFSTTPVNGQAVFNVPTTLALGTYDVTATFTDPALGAASATTSQVVQRGIPLLTVSSPPPAAAAVGQSVSMTIALTADGGLGNLDGGVVVLDNGVPIGFPHNVTAGGVTSATFVSTTLAAGTHRFQYVFLGNPQLFATNTGVFVTEVGGSSGAAAQAAPMALASQTAPATGGVDGVAIADALADPFAKKPRSSSALLFWRGSR